VDIEVLDAIGFDGGKAGIMIMNMPTTGVTPNIVDNTGDGNEVDNGPGATRLSHMTRLGIGATGVGVGATGSTGFAFDVECIDAIACEGTNGDIWILNMPADDSTSYCTTDSSGDASSTRRTHLEVLGPDGASGNSCVGNIIIERVDYLGFTGTNGDVMIIANPSSDDGSGSGRADTFMTPPDYDPTDVTKVPPNIEDNGDPNLYFKFVPRKVPPTPPDSPVEYFIKARYFGYNPLDIHETGGYGFVTVSGVGGYFASSGAASAYGSRLMGQPAGVLATLVPPLVRQGHEVNVWLDFTVSSQLTPPITPVGTTPAYPIGTTTPGDTSPPVSTNPNNVKMGALWWIRKWSEYGDPPPP
jgi:hypothetical protein